MKQAEIQARIATAGLVLIGVVLMIAAYLYGSTAFWAAGLAALGQSVLAGLAMWGLKLGREQEDLAAGGVWSAGTPETGPALGLSGFKMSVGDDEPVSVAESRQSGRLGPMGGSTEVRTLETGFQRVTVALTAAGLVAIACIISYLVYSDFRITDIGEVVPAARRGVALDNLAVTLAVGSLLAYIAVMFATRVNARTRGFGEAVSGTLTMGFPGMVAMAGAIICGWLNVQLAVQIASGFIALLLLVQALELIANSFRSYAGIEEFDQAPVDLQRLPLAPMLTSAWVLGLKSLLAQSVGIARQRRGESGVFARMMPRVLIALGILAVVSSMFRMVRPGEVAIRERLGEATEDDINHPLTSGLHITAPWPIDELVHIPTEAVQQVSVGTAEESLEVNGKKLDFRFWAMRHTTSGEPEQEYVTGDQPAQLLGTYVAVWWRVKDPSKFYKHLSHSEFYETQGSGADAKKVAQPIYQGIVQQLAARAVMQTFVRHTLDEIMGPGRAHVEESCFQTLQRTLNDLDSGIEVIGLTIQDVHPPIGIGIRPKASGRPDLGPAAAYEDAVMAREERETKVDDALAYHTLTVQHAQAEAHLIERSAQTYALQRENEAAGEVERRQAMAQQFAADPSQVRFWLSAQMLDDVLPQVSKILVAPGIQPPEIWQGGKAASAFPPGAPPPR